MVPVALWRALASLAGSMASNHNKKGRSKTGSFVMLQRFMMDSPAWGDLTPAARSIYLEVAKLYNGRNNGFIALSVRDAAERCRVNKDTAAKSLALLQGHGFIECVTPGGFSRKIRHATEWRLSIERCDKTQALPTKAFMRWRPPPGECKTRSGNSALSVPSFGTVTPFPTPKRA
ncbi:MAG: hypothetical protein B7Y81_04240 [Caulobacter sp. 32-67-35]|nr:MAG: hypothetical protein B7Y81_04240 [Caulobacter sp. 32-67-35]